MLWSGGGSSSTTKFISKLNEDTVSVSKALFTDNEITIDVKKAPESSVEAQNFTSFNFSGIQLPTSSADDFILSPIQTPLDNGIIDQFDNDPEFQDFIDNHICDYVHILFTDSVTLEEDTASPSQEEELMEADNIQQMIDGYNVAFVLNEEKKSAEVAALEDTASRFQEEKLMDADIIEQMINDPHIQEFIDNDVSNLLFCYCYGQTDLIDETGYVADDSEDELEPFTDTPAMNNNTSYWSLLNADHQWYLDDPSYWSLLNADHQWHLPS
jgi:hypothetical protein